ncbi:hypothetical protein Cni_G06228 [Canna indica]|uniref:Uncharacterized protein n=1 Tax=Canna indica TaxID=4628 RepID=A0AAQ3K125_9LILI|nr:hypothetical protein Cni_G06228 [Canna indica]
MRCPSPVLSLSLSRLSSVNEVAYKATRHWPVATRERQYSTLVAHSPSTSTVLLVQRSIYTLPKHWTTIRGAEFVASAIVSSLLLDKQQKHQKYLQFLVLTKCHEELCSN